MSGSPKGSPKPTDNGFVDADDPSFADLTVDDMNVSNSKVESGLF
jgi:hypothetical protein